MNYCIGDVHGCGEELQELIKNISPKAEDTIWLLGDLFDRGSNPEIVWEILQRPNVKAIKGNHDLKMEKFLDGRKNFVPPHYNWALKQLNSFGISNESLYNFIRSLPLMVVNENRIFVHAAVCSDDPLRINTSINVYGNFAGYTGVVFETEDGSKPVISDQQREVLYTVEGQEWWDKYNDKYEIFYGHSGRSGEPRIVGNTYCMDTGVYDGNPIWAIRVEDKELFNYQSGINHFKMVKSMLLLDY